MLKIRLTRVGKKNSPAYRVVVADQKKAVKRKFIEILGHYNPVSTPKQLVINKERALHWLGLGAQASDTVNNLMCDLGILDKKAKITKVYGKAVKKKDEGKEPEVKAEAPVAEVPAEETVVKEETEEVKEEAPVAVENTVEEK
jgi:small subunit ribosomal protein S16